MKKELLNLDDSFKALEKLPIANYTILPKNASINKYKEKIRRFGFPCWIKASIGEHKAKEGALIKCHSFKELKEKFGKLKKKFKGKKFVVQKDIKGIKIMAGLKKDNTFGKVLLLGQGGNLAEIHKDTAFRVFPISKKEIHKALEELKIYKILKDYKIKKLVKIIKKFSEYDFAEADLNPIIVNKKDTKIVDARICI